MVNLLDAMERVAHLEQVVEQQAARIASLETELARRKGRGSGGARASSSESASQGSRRSGKRRSSGRSPGGQPGHEGHGRSLVSVEQVDELVPIKPSTCRRCGQALCSDDPHPLRHQEVVIPPVRAQVIEYQFHTLRCRHCYTLTEAPWPEGVSRRTFGPSVQAWVGLLSGAYRLSKRNIVALLSDAFGVHLCPGTVSQLEQEVSAAIAEPVEAARAYDVYSGLVVVEAEWKPEELPLAVAVKTHTSTTGGKNMHPLHYRQKRELVAGRVVLGIDPGKKRHTAWMLDTDGLPRGRAFSFSVDHHGFEEVLWQEVATRLAEYGPEQLVIAVETACNLWKTIASYAHQQGYTVILVSPLTTHHARPLCDHDFSRTDPKDAFLVADQARQGRFDLFQVFDAEIEAMRQLSLAYHKLAKDKQRQRQRLRAFMEQYFPEYLNAFDIESQTSLYLLERYFLPQHFQTLDVEAEARVIAPMSRQQHGVETLLWLQEWANESIGVAAASQEESLRLVLDGWLVQLRVLQAQIKKLRKALIERAARHRAFAILTSIPNISEWLAALFIAECRGLDATTHYKQIDKFAGLKLKVVNSGEFVGQRRISYIGNKRLRKVIYQMTQQTAKAVPQVRCRFLRRQLNQACYRKNIVAASAPLLKLIHALVKQQRPYRPHAKWNKQLMELEKAYTQKKTKQRTRRPPETRRQAA